MFGIKKVEQIKDDIIITIYQSKLWAINNNNKKNYMLSGFKDPYKKNHDYYKVNLVYDFYYTDEMLEQNR